MFTKNSINLSQRASIWFPSFSRFSYRYSVPQHGGNVADSMSHSSICWAHNSQQVPPRPPTVPKFRIGMMLDVGLGVLGGWCHCGGILPLNGNQQVARRTCLDIISLNIYFPQITVYFSPILCNFVFNNIIASVHLSKRFLYLRIGSIGCLFRWCCGNYRNSSLGYWPTTYLRLANDSYTLISLAKT